MLLILIKIQQYYKIKKNINIDWRGDSLNRLVEKERLIGGYCKKSAANFRYNQ